MAKLICEIMDDGSRLFVNLPQSKSSLRLLVHVLTLWGAFPTAFLPGMAESWIDFRFKGERFTINNQFGDYWFFVSDPQCSADTLQQVADHFAAILM